MDLVRRDIATVHRGTPRFMKYLIVPDSAHPKELMAIADGTPQNVLLAQSLLKVLFTPLNLTYS